MATSRRAGAFEAPFSGPPSPEDQPGVSHAPATLGILAGDRHRKDHDPERERPREREIMSEGAHV